MQTRAKTRQALADITPPTESGAIDTTPNTVASTSAPEPKESPPSWASLCVSKDCPIKHPHNFGLRPQPSSASVVIWQDADADAVVAEDGAYADSQPPPLIKAMIDTLRTDPMIAGRYTGFVDVLRDFYRAHGGRSDVYHGPKGMFGLGVDVGGERGCGVYPYHKHPDEEGVGEWFAFEIEGIEESEDLVASGCD